VPRALALVLLAAIPAPRGVLDVVTTSTDLKALVEAVGGERVTVESLAPALHEPHAVDVKPGQLARLRSAALLVRGSRPRAVARRVRALVNDPRFAPAARRISTSPGIDLPRPRRRE
jgi:ABC-type Zn uptake system ZnuABC Zn-binding protein ZnuA